jgi:uncharacterized repeat protein (TIGR01451 family)
MLTSTTFFLRCLAFWLVAMAPLSVWAQACPVDMPVSQTFAVTFSPQVFTVPNNVTRIRLIAVGASGGVATTSANSAGGGARAEGTYSVSSGQTVTVIVGAPGGSGDLEAGGGGASGAYIGTTLAVIGGGGGGEDNTGDGGVGTTTLAGSNGGSPAGGDCTAGGLGGLAGAGGQFGEVPGTAGCQTGDGGGGGGGINGPGGSGPTTGLVAGRISPTGGGQCSILGASGGISGEGNPAGSVGAAGGFGICGGGGADQQESGGGGGYSGGGGGPEGRLPGGGGSFVSGSAVTPTLVAGALTTVAVNGLVRICYSLPIATSLAITKNNSTTTLVAGSTTTYNIVVSNNGPGPADQAVLRDPPTAGLACAAVNCASALGGASCPLAGSTTIANLQSAAGIALPVFPANSSLTFTVTCGVTATGL